MKLRAKIEKIINGSDDPKAASTEICKLFEKEMSISGWFDDEDGDELLDMFLDMIGDDEDDDEDDLF
ncbi:hypothetical protein [Xenorhabdus hominickii]|uniref:Uncharacterized protein n=1 Tax=Xenorhabdus hominickii TaxID=351679 RepID=A0A2G0Q540_XENHO|nr:hypothetical protein [Xenorhabdus hominickii]AOM40054.1 hypothetical protein A9255_05380 [Xenorhabdus hominickii]PHM51679.1 hypothetical protein Xhom_04813 [Xenorhabdus hominickii]PHM54312.1 hypothetical protein Xhom_03389 [Xenorhabdus hominickii]